MRKIFRRLFKVLLGILIIGALFGLGVSIFMNTAPQFGQNPEGEELVRIKNSPNYQEDKFVNLIPTKPGAEEDFFKILYEFFTAKNTIPEGPIPTKFGEGELQEIDSISYLTWYGHSAFLLEMEGKYILLDPMLGPYAAPVSFFGKRWKYKEPIDLTNLPEKIDAVILSHDHYDHLDYPTIVSIKDRVEHFFMPLGMGGHFIRWGVEKEKITELDWWQESDYNGLKLAATPARHFSGRGIKRDQTLWASWVIQSSRQSLYFSGDGGYFDTFKEIGQKYGPFDFTMIECGQYNVRWPQIHMMPEESVQAHIDLGGKVMMPIHWGAFDLAPHAWKDPIERAEIEAKRRGVKLFVPIVGQRFAIRDSIQGNHWWEDMD